MKHYILLLWRLLQFKMSSKLIYRFDFWAAFFADGTLFIVQILMFGTIFTLVDSINGWDLHEIIIFTGTFTIVDGFAMGTYFFGVISIPEKIRTGDLDRYLIKPVNPLFLVSFDRLNPGSLFIAVLGVMIVSFGVTFGQMTIAPIQVVFYILAMISMYVLMYSLMVLLRVMAFWVVKIQSIQEIENKIIELGFRIPGSAFQGGFKIFFMVLVPYALIASGPTYVLTSLGDFKIYIWTFVASGLFFMLATYLFKKGIGNYSSASS